MLTQLLVCVKDQPVCPPRALAPSPCARLLHVSRVAAQELRGGLLAREGDGALGHALVLAAGQHVLSKGA